MKKKQLKITTVMALSVITMSATTPVLTAHADDVAEPATEEQAQEIINTLDLPEVAADAPTVEPETVEETAPVAETAVEEEPEVQVIEEAEDDTSFSANNIISPMAEEDDYAIDEEDIFLDPTNIIVEYVTEDGAPIAKPTTGLYYADDTYSFTAPTIENYDLVGTSSYSGEVTEAMAGESITITFTYVRAASAPELGSITVNINYVDYNGDTIAPSQTFQLEKGRRHAIDAVLDIENYIIDDNERIDADGNYVVVIRDDEYTDNTLNLNILYHPEGGYSEDEDDDLITAPLYVNYVDTEGRNIAPSEVQDLPLFHSFRVEAIAIPGYSLVSDNIFDGEMQNESGEVVNFVYERIESEGEQTEAQVLISYYDVNTMEPISGTAYTMETIGTTVQYEAPIIEGYTILPEYASISQTIFTEGALFEFYYTKDSDDANRTAWLTINYMDTAGNVLSEPKHIEYAVGEFVNFEVDRKFDGYSIIGANEATFEMPAEGYTHTFFYQDLSKPDVEEYGNLVISYRDLEGNDLLPSETQVVQVGTNATITARNIEGYELQSPATQDIYMSSVLGQSAMFVYAKIAEELPDPVEPTEPEEEIPAPTPVDPDDTDEVTPPSDDNDDSNDETTPSDDNDDADSSDNTSGGTNRPIFNDTNEDESEVTNNSSSDKIKTENTSRGDSNNKSESTTDSNDESLPQANESAKTSILVSTLGAMMLATLAFVSRKRFSTKK